MTVFLSRVEMVRTFYLFSPFAEHILFWFYVLYIFLILINVSSVNSV